MASLVVKTLSCEFELYVTDDLKPFALDEHGAFSAPAIIFLGLPVSVDAPILPPTVGGVQGRELDVVPGDAVIKNVFIRHKDLIYLFVLRDVTEEKLRRFRFVLQSFTFRDDPARGADPNRADR